MERIDHMNLSLGIMQQMYPRYSCYKDSKSRTIILLSQSIKAEGEVWVPADARLLILEERNCIEIPWNEFDQHVRSKKLIPINHPVISSSH